MTYGSIARLRIRKDRVRDLLALGREWDERERMRAAGYLSSQILWDEKDEGAALLVTHFASREQYWKNANSPEQDAFFRRFRECLEADPEWTDGEFQQWDSPFVRPPSWSEKAEG